MKGFSLLEVVIAMVLLTVGILTLLSVLISGMSQEEATREYDIARNAALAKIEEIRSKYLSDVYDAYNNTYFAIDGLTAPTGWANPGRIEINNTISDLYGVTITIRWQIQGNTNPYVYNELVTQSLVTRRAKY